MTEWNDDLVTKAILDRTDQWGNRASLGHVIELLNDKDVADNLFCPDPRRDAKPIRQKLCDVRDRYDRVSTGSLFRRVRELRHNQIAHLLVRDEPAPQVEYADIFALADEIETMLVNLYEGFGIRPPHFTGLKAQNIQEPKLFWQTYFAGVACG
jgi:hypothetical protein